MTEPQLIEEEIAAGYLVGVKERSKLSQANMFLLSCCLIVFLVFFVPLLLLLIFILVLEPFVM